MVTRCPYCGGRVYIDRDGKELVCHDCATVIGPVYVYGRVKKARSVKEAVLMTLLRA